MGRTEAPEGNKFDKIISTHSPRVGRTWWIGQHLLGRSYFNSLAPCGANPARKERMANPHIFQLTRPVWGEPGEKGEDGKSAYISTHSPRVGRTLAEQLCNRQRLHFNSLAPCGANRVREGASFAIENFNSLAPCGANHAREYYDHIDIAFQLTRPVWGEPRNYVSKLNTIYISTHSPRVGRTAGEQTVKDRIDEFQLTRPVWGEPVSCSVDFVCPKISTHSPRVGRTSSTKTTATPTAYFNSLAPCGANPRIPLKEPSGRPFQLTRTVWGEPIERDRDADDNSISTHSPRVGRTLPKQVKEGLGSIFQLTRPVWGEPKTRAEYDKIIKISTHSPRVGRTVGALMRVNRALDFNSLAPCGANHGCAANVARRDKFQLTRPVWGEPQDPIQKLYDIVISTHSPRVGRTAMSSLFISLIAYISTHSPRVGRTPKNFYNYLSAAKFQLTRPVWGEPMMTLVSYDVSTISTHSPRVGRTTSRISIILCCKISTHSPRVGRTKWFDCWL